MAQVDVVMLFLFKYVFAIYDIGDLAKLFKLVRRCFATSFCTD